MIIQLQNKQYRLAVEYGVNEIGKVLNLFYNQQKTDKMSELTNHPIILN